MSFFLLVLLALLPFSIRVILESAVRNCNELEIKSKDVKNILNWPDTHLQNVEVPFMPSRVILQDFT
jgi:aconitate hydratase